MPDTWFTADFHLGHANIIRFCSRPFATVGEMDQAILERLNASVKANDILYFLGDFCMGGHAPVVAYRRRIGCQKIFALRRRQLKPTIRKLGLPASVDFRSFRTMHSSLMSSIGVRPEVTRDNMGHATVDVTQNVYNRTWWEERVEAVSLAAATVWREFLAQPVAATRM